jgi:amino acid permease
MKKTSEFEKMVNVTIFGVILCCLVVAWSGYYMFGCTVEDQVTLSLESSVPGGGSKAMTMLTWLMIMTAFSKFTLTAFPLALGLEEIIAKWIPSDNIMEIVSSLIKIFLVTMALLVAIFIPSFSFLCSLVGLVCTMIVSVIFPAAAHLRLFGSKLPLWEKLLDWFFILCGVFMAIVGTYATV